MWERASQRAFRCDDIEETFEVLGFTSSLSFTYSSYASFFFFLRVVGMVSPFQWLSFFGKVSPQTEVYFQGLSQ